MKKLQAVLFAFIAIIILAPTAAAAESATNTKIDDIKFFVENFYYGDIPKNLNDMTTVEEIMDALDDYSRYMSATEYNDYVASVGADDLALADLDKPGVTSALLYGDIGYIRVKTFSGTMNKDIINHYLKLKKQGADKLILDLRYNGGGYVESAEQLLGHFQGVKTAYEMKTREGTTTIKPVPSKVKFPEKTYVLVNRYSASASEIVAASLQDQNAAIVVGEKTKGKGTIQSFFEFEDGSALKLTIGEFTGPKQKKIHHVGITPTIKAEHDKELTTIHERLVKETLTQRQFNALENVTTVPSNKTFQIHFTQEMNLTATDTSSKVELVKVGGVSVPIIVKQNGTDKLAVTPNKQMQKGGSYYLVIHPGFTNTVGRTTKNGTFTFFTVE
ncbi:Ig-like domain-containing protein [Sporosarcina sp. Sa2YVA2]|uniref:Ig-like domain-containing protein n=1 Tax=Sporosarcina quadrami TaxID=2762234 RepID=A0ABR8U994_9BACL|nr:S41 family peptidase [Sporosarcina quadrami]MBD7984597.1 Ig-like domain-containing protein [Sporosarcina quadrami]